MKWKRIKLVKYKEKYYIRLGFIFYSYLDREMRLAWKYKHHSCSYYTISSAMKALKFLTDKDEVIE